jgi:hypothetical protein
MKNLILAAWIMLVMATGAIAQDEYPRQVATTKMPNYTITVTETSPGVKTVRFDGAFTYMSDYFLNVYLQTHRPAVLEMNSNGGNLSALAAPGQTIRRQKIRVRVLEGEYCLSACAFMAMYSPSIDIQGQLGFHVPYRLYFEYDETIQDVYNNGVFVTISMITQFHDNGWPMYLYYWMAHETNRLTYMVFTDSVEFDSYRWDSESDIPFNSEDWQFSYKLMSYEEINRAAQLQNSDTSEN